VLITSAEPAIISGRNAGIVRAAQRAGFDCSNFDNVIELVSAVRDAASDLSFANVYGNSPIRRRDHWEPADEHRARKGVLQAYRGARMFPSVPPFVISADQIIRNMDRANNTDHLGYPNFSENAMQIHPARKRMIGAIDYQAASSKKPKLEAANPSTIDGRTVIDLTEETPVGTPVMCSPTQLPTLRPALSNITNRASQLETLTENSSTRRQTPLAPGNKNSKATKEENKEEQAMTKDELEQRNSTTNILQKIVTRLQNTEKSIDKDRDRLRNRWEMDTGLQVQTVTDSLSDLNECFARIEDGIRDALAIINERLLS
jgi:hypothetical protein